MGCFASRVPAPAAAVPAAAGAEPSSGGTACQIYFVNPSYTMPRRSRRPQRKRTKVMGGRKRTINKMRRQVHVFKRTAYLGTVTAQISALGVATPVANAYVFTLNQLPSVGDFTSLFDQYKITGAKLQLTPALSEGISSPLFGTASTLGYSRVHSVIDYDDASAPASEDQMLEYGSHKSTAPFQKHSRFIRPKVLHEIYRSAIATAYAPKSNTYLDMTNTDVPHYGIKVWISAPNTTAGTAGSIAYKVYQTLYFTCKNTR